MIHNSGNYVNEFNKCCLFYHINLFKSELGDWEKKQLLLKKHFFVNFATVLRIYSLIIES